MEMNRGRRHGYALARAPGTRMMLVKQTPSNHNDELLFCLLRVLRNHLRLLEGPPARTTPAHAAFKVLQLQEEFTELSVGSRLGENNTLRSICCPISQDRGRHNYD